MPCKPGQRGTPDDKLCELHIYAGDNLPLRLAIAPIDNCLLGLGEDDCRPPAAEPFLWRDPQPQLSAAQ